MSETLPTFKNAIGESEAQMLIDALAVLNPDTNDPTADFRRKALLELFAPLADAPGGQYWTLAPETSDENAPDVCPDHGPSKAPQTTLYEIDWTFGGTIRYRATSPEAARERFHENAEAIVRAALADDCEGPDIISVEEATY